MTKFPLEPSRILVVDDDQNVLNMLVELLELEGYEVSAARDGARALDLMASCEPDLVVSDVVMPILDGIELCRRIKQNIQTANIPVLLMSGSRQTSDDRMEGLTAGADDYLDIPFRHEALLVKVARLSERRRVEKHYREIVEQAADMIYTRSMDGYLTSINAAGGRFFNRPVSELIGVHLSELIGIDAAARDIKQTQEFPPDSPARSPHCIRDAKGKTRYLEGIVTVERDRRGLATCVRGVVRDITEQRDNEENYRELFENANDIIYTHDLSGNFTSLNRSGERITGYSWAEASRMNIADVVTPEGLDLARQAIANKARGKAPTVYELDLMAKDGRIVRLEVSTRVIQRGGEAVGVQGIARDLTERKLSEDALRESQAFFNSFMDNSPAIAFMKDAEGRYVYVNKPFEDLFGQKLPLLRGGTSFDWLPHDTARKTHEHDLQVLLLNEAQEIVETVPMRDGLPHHWLVFKFPITDAAGKRFVGGVGVDISERRRAEEALALQAQREEMTHRISQGVRYSLDSSEIFQTAVRELGSYLRVDRCSIFTKNEGAQQAINVAEYHADGVASTATDFDLADSGSLASLRQNGVLVFDDASRDERIREVYDHILSRGGVRSIMYVAIRVGDDMPAVFVLSTTRELRNWSESDITLAKAVADQTGIAIRQAKLYQKAEATSIREALVNRLTVAIRASLSLPEVLSTATRELGGALSASRVHLHLYSPENPVSPVVHEFLAPGCTGFQQDANYDDPMGRYLLGTLQPLVIADALNYSEGPAEFSAFVLAHAQKVNLRSQIDYPVIVKGQFRGVICIHQTDRTRHWTDDELALVEAVAARLAIGISQAELFEMVDQRQAGVGNDL
ncbi:hypothetical protein BH18ACI4_BH18ACI4_08230 [soil metagenome]